MGLSAVEICAPLFELRGLALRLTGGHAADAEDLMQATAETAIRYQSQVTHTPKRWLAKIMYHRANDLHRNPTRKIRFISLDDAIELPAQDDCENQRYCNEVLIAINTLSTSHKLVLIKAMFGEERLPIEKSRLARARTELKKKLGA